MMEVVLTTGAINRGKLQSNHLHQQTNNQLFTGRMPFLSVMSSETVGLRTRLVRDKKLVLVSHTVVLVFVMVLQVWYGAVKQSCHALHHNDLE